MSGRLILSFSAIFLFIAGGATLFAPGELARAFDPTGSRALPVTVQLIGSGFLGFALMNWMSRRNRIGGIYARPLGMGNLLLFATAALTVGKAAAARNLPAAGMGVCMVLAMLAVSFAWLVFVHDPISDEPTTTTV
jgi:hypothetical protein